MNDLLQDFLTETHESLEVIDSELVRFEREPNNAQILGHIFRLVHTVKGTCGFLGLPRLEALTHAAETLMGRYRDGKPVTRDSVSLVLAVIDRLKEILTALEEAQLEPVGDDGDLIHLLELAAGESGEAPEAARSVGTLVDQTLERALRPGEVSLDELERAFRETPGPQAAADDERRSGQDRRDEQAREGTARSQTLRVQVETLERLMTTVSELVLTRNELFEIMRRTDNPELNAPFQRLSSITGELQEGVMKTRMQPIGSAWAKLPRIVRDLADELGKKIDLDMQGEETELDRQLLDLVRDPLTHMVRNSADHGIEMPDERRAAGKPDTGTIRLAATHEGGHIIIEVSDDGRGLDTERIRAKGLRLGFMTEAAAARLTDAQVHKFIFAPGFSTARTVTSVSGRGVGMDVVKANIDHIGGSIDIRSEAGRGTTLRIKVPLTLAIVPALIVDAQGERFAIPQIAVDELVRTDTGSGHRLEWIKDAAVLRLRDRLLPVIDLGATLRLGGRENEAASQFVVVMLVGNRRFGVLVDQVMHTEEIVVKPMSSMLRGIGVFSGNTILGDGSVILILDPNGVAEFAGGERETIVAVEDVAAEAEADDSEADTSLLVFRAGSDGLKAVPVSLVTRLEEIDADRIEFSNGRAMVQYRGGLMPLLTVEAGATIRREGSQSLLVFIDRDRAMGLAVDEIVDIVEERLDIELGSRNAGVLGSAIVQGRATDIVDVGHYLPLAFDDWLHRSETPIAEATRRILLVDDSAFFRNMLTPVLQAAGYAVKSADGAEAALAVLERDSRFDFVVSDIEMPGINGFEFAERLRAHPRAKDLPMIALSSLGTPDAIERGRQAGFDGFVAKFDRGGLIELLRKSHLEWKRAA